MRHFSFDPFKHRPREECSVAALRAQATHVDLSPISGGGKPPAADTSQPITTGDVAKQLATAFQSPAE